MGALKIAKQNILIVDDEADFRQLLGMSFESAGYTVFRAGNAKEAMELIRAHDIDVVVSDIRMPGGDGIELLDQVKQQKPNTPMIVLVTGEAELSTADAHAKGAAGVFVKPLNVKDLRYTIERLLLPVGLRAERQERINMQLPIQLHFQNNSSPVQTTVLNLSTGGMFILLEDAFPSVNDMVTFNIELKDFRLSGQGHVRWLRTRAIADLLPGCGVEFSNLSEAQTGKINELIQAKKRA